MVVEWEDGVEIVKGYLPTTVPCAVVPFFSSMVTVSRRSFTRKRTSFMALICELMLVMR